AHHFVLPNGLCWLAALAQFLETEQHGEHAFQFTIEMNLVAAKPLKLVRLQRFAERLLADQRSIRQFLFAVFKPRQHFVLEESPYPLHVSGSVFLILLHLVRPWSEGVRP